MRGSYRFLLAFYALVSLISFTNCGDFAVSKNSPFDRQKNLLSNAPIFAAATAPTPDPCTPKDPYTPLPAECQRATPPPVAPIAPLDKAVETICSNDGVAKNGGSIVGATNLKAILFDNAGKSVCEIDDSSIRQTLINEKHLLISGIDTKCPGLAPGQYTLQLKSPTSGNLLTAEAANYFEAFLSFFYGQAKPVSVTISKSGERLALAPSNAGAPMTVLMNVNPGGYDYAGATPDCYFAGSPLIVQIRPRSSRPLPISLTAPLSGVKFDILGENSFPQPHSPKQISWFPPSSSAGNFFLTLPDGQGRIMGVNQLFGDNTRGPDGKFAANGYEALRKFDGRRDDGNYDPSTRDGAITHADAVFSRLRLWSDLNGDGVADPSEVFKLAELGVVSINLNYDPSFKEVDRYGNEIKMKSSVLTSDGLLHVMYDIWFRIID